MRIMFIGTVDFSEKMLRKLISLKAEIAGVVTKKIEGRDSDLCDLSSVCEEHGLPYIYAENVNSRECIDWIKAKSPDIIFCFGLSQLIRNEILNIPPMGIVGYHPAELPRNRGRHPIIWSLVLGLTRTASTFFFLDDKTDSGDILHQAVIDIDMNDDARSLYDKMVQTALSQLEELLPQLQNNTFKRIPQDPQKASYWRKRYKEDGRIDFRMSSTAVYNLVRALARPYPGAHLLHKGKEIKVWKVEEVKADLSGVEYGKVLDTRDGNILVKCQDDAVLLTEHEFAELPKAGEYLL